MKIAIIGSGNVGGALAQKWIKAGHQVVIGARFPLSEKSIKLAARVGEDRFTTVQSAVKQSDIILVATPAPMAVDVAHSLGDTSGKIIIDTMNIIMGRGPEGFNNTSHAILANTKSNTVIKCFNTTGYNNMIDKFIAILLWTCSWLVILMKQKRKYANLHWMPVSGSVTT